MAITTSTSTIPSFSISSGGIYFKARDHGSEKSCFFGRTNCLTFQRKLNQQTSNRKLSVRAEYSDRSCGVGGEFFAGFLLGGALCGALAYIYEPQVKTPPPRLYYDLYSITHPSTLNPQS